MSETNKKETNKKFKVNTNKIKALIIERGLKQGCVAEEIGLNESTFNLKINNKRRIYMDEVIKLCMILDITTPSKLKECFNLDFLILQNSSC